MPIIIDPDELANVVKLYQEWKAAPEEKQFPIVEQLTQARKRIFDANGYHIDNPNFELVLEAMQEKIIEDHGRDAIEYKALFGMSPYTF